MTGYIKHTMDAPSAAIAKVVVVHVLQTRLEKCRYIYIYICTKTSSLDRMPTRIVHVQQRQPNFPCIGVTAARQWSEIICQKRSSSGISLANPLQHARFQATLHVDDNKLGPCIFVDSAHTKRDSCCKRRCRLTTPEETCDPVVHKMHCPMKME